MVDLWYSLQAVLNLILDYLEKNDEDLYAVWYAAEVEDLPELIEIVLQMGANDPAKYERGLFE